MRSFVRRAEFAISCAVLFLMVLILCRPCREELQASPVVNPIPVTPVVTVPPQRIQPYRPPTVVVHRPPYRPYRPYYVPRRRYVLPRCGTRWTRPGYVWGQPVRNVLRFVFTPRWS